MDESQNALHGLHPQSVVCLFFMDRFCYGFHIRYHAVISRQHDDHCPDGRILRSRAPLTSSTETSVLSLCAQMIEFRI